MGYIQTSVYGYTPGVENKIPDAVDRDSRGVLIQEGLKVAFNRSGNVMIGTVVSVKSVWKKQMYKGKFSSWRLDFVLKVENEKGVKSIVKNPNSFVII